MHSVAQIAAGAAVAGLWQGLLLAAVLWIALRATPRLSAATRFAIWSAGFVSILLLPLFSFMQGLGSNAAPQAAIGANHPALHVDARWALAIAAVWLAMSLARAFSLAVNAVRVRALWKSAIPVEIDALLRSHLKAAGAPRTAQIYRSTEIDQPCVIGFFRPRILVPEWLLEKATPSEMRQIALHEASHLRRWDDWTNLGQKLALVIFPLNPALWWIERLLCSEREEACDERVVRETRSPREYAVCLTNLAAERMERRMRRHTAALSLGAWERRSALARRVHSILRSGPQLSSLKGRAIMAALVVATTTGAVKLGGASQLVEFTPAETMASNFAEQAHPALLPASNYHDVVFREPVVQHGGLASRGVTANSVALSGSQAKPLKLNKTARQVSSGPGRPILRRAGLSPNGPASWVVVTRWETSADPQAGVMIIQSVLRFSPSSAAENSPDGLAAVPTQTGWFVFQL